MAHGEEYHLIQLVTGSSHVQPVLELYRNYEKPDTRTLYLTYAAKTSHCSHSQTQMSWLLQLANPMKTMLETGDKWRTLNVSITSQHLTVQKTKALIGLHNFTGCDQGCCGQLAGYTPEQGF